MISEFIDETTAVGITGILPKNLESKWFEPILNSSIEFLRIIMSGAKTDPETFLNDEKGMLLLAAVTELIQHRYDYPAHFQINSVPREHLFDSMSCYSIAVLMEDAKRELGIKIPDIDEETILEKEFITGIEADNEEISNYLYHKISS